MSNYSLPPLLGTDPRFRVPLGTVLRPESRLPGGPAGLPVETQVETPETSQFGQALTQALGHTGSLQDDVQQKTRGLVLGEGVELHDVMLATDKSEVTFNLLLEVRNKLVDAWEKLSRSAV